MLSLEENKLLLELVRTHLVGKHPSYDSYNAFRNIENALEEIIILQDSKLNSERKKINHDLSSFTIDIGVNLGTNSVEEIVMH